MNNYLPEPLIEYFNETEDELERFLFARKFPTLAKAEAVRPEILNHKKYRFLRKKIYKDALSGLKKWHTPHTGAFYNLYLFLELGFDINDSFIKNTIDYFLENFLLHDGGFSFNWKPLSASALWTGEFLYLISLAGYGYETRQSIAEWIIKHQHSDGGWFTSPVKTTTDAFRLALGGKVKANVDDSKDSELRSCIYATASCIKGLMYHNFAEAQKKVSIPKANSSSIDAGLKFFIEEKLFFKDKIASLDGFQHNNCFRKIGYPIFGQFDLLAMLLLFSKSELKKHNFAISAINYLLNEKRVESGWRFSSKAAFMLEDSFKMKVNSSKNKPDAFATLRMMEILNSY